SLRTRTLTAALQFAKDDPISMLVSASAASLVEGGLRTMFLVKVKILLVLLLVAGLALGSAGLFAHQILDAKRATEPQPGSERAATPAAENKPQAAVDRFGDPLPERAVARLGTIRFRTGGLVHSCAYSPDGKTLAAGNADNTISLFDAATGK